MHLYNFFPENALESLLGILERLYQKLDAINRSVGLDVSTLGETPTPKDFGFIRDLFGCLGGSSDKCCLFQGLFEQCPQPG